MIGRQNSTSNNVAGASRKRGTGSQDSSEMEPLVLVGGASSTGTASSHQNSSGNHSPMVNMVISPTHSAPQSGNHTSLLPVRSSSQSSKNHPRHYPTVSAYVQSFFTSTTSIKFIVLIVLSLQNSLFTVLRRYSQGIRQETYSKYEVLMMGEVIKLVFSSYMVRRAMTVDNNNSSNNKSIIHSDDPTNIATTTNLTTRLMYLTNHSGKMIGLAVIYGIMNILSFVALRNIGAGTFTIFAQCKILTTAAFSAMILHRHYSITKWRALIALVFGVLLFSEPIWNKPTTTLEQDSNNPMVVIGIAAVLIEVILSGFASIYFEKVIKLDPLPLTIWERNFQLALVRSGPDNCSFMFMRAECFLCIDKPTCCSFFLTTN